VRAVRPVRMMSLTRIGGVERRANTGARLTFSSGAAGAKVPIELLGLLKGKESRCGGYGGAHALSTCCAICCQALQTRSESDFHPPGSSAWSNRKPFPVTAACEGSRPERE